MFTLSTPCRTVMNMHEPCKQCKQPRSSLSRINPRQAFELVFRCLHALWCTLLKLAEQWKLDMLSNAKDRNNTQQACQESGWFGDHKTDAKGWGNIIDIYGPNAKGWSIQASLDITAKWFTTGNVRQCDYGQFGDRRMTKGRMWEKWISSATAINCPQACWVDIESCLYT